MIWNESIECMERDNLHKIQSIRLKKIVEYVYHNTPFYRKKMQELGITPDDINGIEDISKLPFTTKLDLRDNYPFGVRTYRLGQNVCRVPSQLMVPAVLIYFRYLTVTVCLRADWVHMPVPRISERRLSPCQVVIRKSRLH